MNTYDLPVSRAHWKALESRRKMLDARPKESIGRLPEELARDASGCDAWFAKADEWYAAAASAYLAGDVATGTLCQQMGQGYMAMGHTCEADKPCGRAARPDDWPSGLRQTDARNGSRPRTNALDENGL